MLQVFQIYFYILLNFVQFKYNTCTKHTCIIFNPFYSTFFLIRTIKILNFILYIIRSNSVAFFFSILFQLLINCLERFYLPSLSFIFELENEHLYISLRYSLCKFYRSTVFYTKGKYVLLYLTNTCISKRGETSIQFIE